MKTGLALMREIRETRVEPGHYALWWFGQQSWVVKTAACLAGIDLFLSPHPRRRHEALIRPEEAGGFDLFLGTHDHKDHIDRAAWPAMAKASPRANFGLPMRVRSEVMDATGIEPERLAGLDDGRTLVAGDLTVTAVPSAHEWIDNQPGAGGHRWLGYVLETAGCAGAVYHAGDTCLWEGLSSRLSGWRVAAALLPINGRDAERYRAGVLGCMLYQEAGDLAGRIGAALVMPGHYDAFVRDQVDPGLFAEYVASRYPGVGVATPERGLRIDV